MAKIFNSTQEKAVALKNSEMKLFYYPKRLKESVVLIQSDRASCKSILIPFDHSVAAILGADDDRDRALFVQIKGKFYFVYSSAKAGLEIYEGTAFPARQSSREEER